jgi:ribosome-associated toxin RatA of RatAB toxin-antitoxin module
MSRATHVLEINQPPSIISKTLLDANNIGEWAPTVVSSTCSEESLKEGTNFSLKEDLKKIGGPKFEADIVVEKLTDKEIVWRQVKGPMKRLEWHFELSPTEKGTLLRLTIDYDMPYPIMGALLDKLKMNRVIGDAIQMALEGLKRKVESNRLT